MFCSQASFWDTASAGLHRPTELRSQTEQIWGGREDRAAARQICRSSQSKAAHSCWSRVLPGTTPAILAGLFARGREAEVDQTTHHSSIRRRTALLTLACAAPLFLGGCQAAVMVGRILFGDPLVPSALESSAGVRLEEEDATVFVVCTSPSVTTTRYETLAVDLPDELERRLKRRGIKTGDTADAMNATADFGGQFSVRDVAEHLDEGYLVHIDFERFSLTEDNGNTLYRGRAGGTVAVYEIEKPSDDADDESASEATSLSDGTIATEIFRRGFETTYPGSHPVPVDQTPEKVFRKRFIAHMSELIGRKLYRYRVSETL